MSILKFMEDYKLINKLLLDKENQGMSLYEAKQSLIQEELLKEGITPENVTATPIKVYNEILKNNKILSFLHAVTLSPSDDNKYLVLKYNLRYKRYYKLADYARSLVVSREELKIVSQGFTKFYNLGEKDITPKVIEEELIDNLGYVVDKLDGTNITSRFVDDSLLTSTTGNLTKKKRIYNEQEFPNFIIDSELYIHENKNYHQMISENPSDAFIFEFITDYNQIVVKYDKSDYGLHLIGVRRFTNEDGTESHLLPQPEVAAYAEKYGVKYSGYKPLQNVDELISYVNGPAYSGKEGVVLYVGDNIYKIKADDYTLVHQLKMKHSIKTPDDLFQFINLLVPLIVNEKLDDYMGIYKGKVPDFVRNLIDEIDKKYFEVNIIVDTFLNENTDLEGKEFFAKVAQLSLPMDIKNVIGVKKKNQNYSRLIINYLIAVLSKELKDTFEYEKEKVETMEIEKKYLISDKSKEQIMNFVKNITPIDIKQNYISISDEEEVRVRIEKMTSYKDKYTFTKKIGNGLVREEIEHEINVEEFNEIMKSLKDKEAIHKHRYKVEHESFVFEVDVYQNESLKGLIVVEIELTSEIDVKKLESILPSFIQNDVTEDKQFKNKNLWKKINQ